MTSGTGARPAAPRTSERKRATVSGQIIDSLSLIRAGLVEALWPERCVICDTPGALLCDACTRGLPYLDQLLACPTCGAPWGRAICCECNQQTLRFKGLERFPLEGSTSATMLCPETKRIITAFKDRGDLGLAAVIARHLANTLPNTWTEDSALVPIPARKSAVRQRGFSHIDLVARELSQITGIPLLRALEAKPRRDQRNLDAKQRLANMAGSFAPAGGSSVRARLRMHPTLILVDDVFTTGATLFTAAEALRPLGAKKIYALTFIRA